jgi:hypothetical protein
MINNEPDSIIERYSREEMDRYQGKNETHCQKLQENVKEKEKRNNGFALNADGIGEEKQIKTQMLQRGD